VKKKASIEIRQSLSSADLFNFSMVSFLRSIRGRVMFVIYLVGILFSTAYLYTAINAGNITAEVVIWSTFFLLVFPVIFIGSIWYGNRIAYKRMADRFADMRFMLTEEGVAVSLGGADYVRYGWDHYRRGLETKQHLILYFSPQAAHILLKSAFTPPQLEAARALLTDKLGKL
jgi:hypothetical protein